MKHKFTINYNHRDLVAYNEEFGIIYLFDTVDGRLVRWDLNTNTSIKKPINE